jgi:hypothetical protein
MPFPSEETWPDPCGSSRAAVGGPHGYLDQERRCPPGQGKSSRQGRLIQEMPLRIQRLVITLERLAYAPQPFYYFGLEQTLWPDVGTGRQPIGSQCSGPSRGGI